MIKIEPKLSRRTLSTLIDYGIYLGFFIWIVTTYGTKNDDNSYSLNGLKGIWIEIVWFIYFPAVESIKGQTLGKLLTGLRVVTKNGNPISLWQSTKRHLLDPFDFIFVGLIAYITIKNTPDHQRLGDLWAKTIVVGGEGFDCPTCHEKLSLSADEIVNKQFVCPKCQSTTQI